MTTGGAKGGGGRLQLRRRAVVFQVPLLPVPWGSTTLVLYDTTGQYGWLGEL